MTVSVTRSELGEHMSVVVQLDDAMCHQVSAVHVTVCINGELAEAGGVAPIAGGIADAVELDDARAILVDQVRLLGRVINRRVDERLAHDRHRAVRVPDHVNRPPSRRPPA